MGTARRSPGARACKVDDDSEHPGAEVRSALESVEVAEHRQPRPLNDLLGDSSAAHVRKREREHHAAPASDQLGEDLLVAFPQGRQLCVVAAIAQPARPTYGNAGHQAILSPQTLSGQALAT